MTHQIRTALVFAALILIVALGGNRAQELGWIASEPERISGVIAGLILIWFGNAMPKERPHKSCKNEPGAAFRMKRFAGIAFVLAGAAHALVWIFGPSEHVGLLAAAPVALAVVVTLAVALRTKVFV